MPTEKNFRSAYASGAITPKDVLDFHRLAFGGVRMEAENAGEGGEDQQQQATGDKTDEGAKTVNKHGFPENTSTKDMTAEQQAAYWQYHSRKHEDEKKTLAQQVAADKDAAQKWRDHEKAQKPPEQQAIESAREEAKAEARREMAAEAISAIMTVSLTDRGRSAEQVQAITKGINPTGFLTDEGQVDHKALQDYLDVVAPKQDAKDPKQQRWPEMGQGQQQGAPATGIDAGRALFEAEKAKRSGKTSGN